MSAPTDVTIAAPSLRVEPRGVWNKVLALSRGFEIPLTSIRSVESNPTWVTNEWMNWKPNAFRKGSFIPGKLRAGTFRPFRKTEGRREVSWWLVKHPDRILVLELAGFRYDRIVVEVDNPEHLAVEIRSASQLENAA